VHRSHALTLQCTPFLSRTALPMHVQCWGSCGGLHFVPKLDLDAATSQAKNAGIAHLVSWLMRRSPRERPSAEEVLSTPGVLPPRQDEQLVRNFRELFRKFRGHCFCRTRALLACSIIFCTNAPVTVSLCRCMGVGLCGVAALPCCSYSSSVSTF